jgi:hypothetical protein
MGYPDVQPGWRSFRDCHDMKRAHILLTYA